MLVVASNALGWGREGHRVVSTIAEKHLTAIARERVQQILGPEGLFGGSFDVGR